MSGILWPVVLLVTGFLLLIKGADYFVEGSSAVAKRLRVPPVIVGLTIVAMGTSLPECAVSLTASLAGNNALAVSNAVGSNIFNLLVVCGTCALFAPVRVEKGTMKKEFPFSILCVLLLLALGYAGMELGRTDGLVFLAVFVCFLYRMVQTALRARAQTDDAENTGGTLPVWRCIVYIAGGAAAIRYGGDFVVEGASAVAARMGLSQNLIGLTIVACGTSLPELVTSVVAARKNQLEMALGNVIGSNIFNILFVLGVSSAISPIAFIGENVTDILILMWMSVAVWIFAWTKQAIEKKEGVLMLLMYAVYLVSICVR